MNAQIRTDLAPAMSRRHFLTATGGLGAGLLLGACSTGAPAATSSTTACRSTG